MYRLIPALCLAGIIIIGIAGCNGGDGPVAPVDANKPAACFTFEPSNGIAPGETVIYDAGCSTGGMFGIASYTWQWGDGSEALTTTEAVASHEYASSGTWEVTLTVRNEIGKADSSVESIEINPVGMPPEACFSWDSPDGWQPGTMHYFDASCSSDPEGGPLVFEWDWGDGMTSGPSSISTASHEFTALGEFNVRLTVKDSAGWEAVSESVTFDLGYPISPPEIGALDLRIDAEDLAISGNYAYAATGTGLSVVDISNKSNPTEVGKFPAGGLQKVDVDGDRIAICSEVEVFILDVSDPENPTGLAYLHAPYNCSYSDIVLAGNYIYIVDIYLSSYVFKILRILPDWTFEQLISVYTGNSGSAEMALDNNILVANQTTGILLADVSNPSTPALTAIDAPDSYRYYAAAVSGDYLYATSRSYPQRVKDTLSVFDISDIENPELIQSTIINNIEYISIDGDYLLLGEDGLELVDISNPSMPSIINAAPVNGYINAIELVGESAMVAGTETTLSVIDFSSRTGPHYVAGFSYSEPSSDYPYRGVEVHGNYLFAGSLGDSIKVFDISNPEIFEPVTQIFFPDTLTAFCINNDTLFTSLDTGVLQLYDISNPLALIPTGFENVGRFSDMIATDEYLYGRGTSNRPALTVVDISDPQNIERLGRYTAQINGESIAMRDDIVYVTADVFLIPVDVSDPRDPDTQTAVGTSYRPMDLELAGDLLYVPCYNQHGKSTVVVFNLSNPSEPNLIATIEVERTIGNIRIAGDYAYSSEGDGALKIYDVSSPYQLIPVGYAGIPLGCEMVDVAGNYAYAISIGTYDSAVSVIRLW